MSMLDTSNETLRGLDTVRVKKDELLERVQKNKEEHRAIFEEAMAGWKIAVTNALEEAYNDALEGKDFKLHINLVRPEDHTDDYDTIIEMLTMSQDEELELTRRDFASFALDKWDWQDRFLDTSTMYVSSVSNKRLIDAKYKDKK